MNINQLSNVISDNVETISTLSDQGGIPKNEAMIFEKLMGLRCVPRDNHINNAEQINHAVEKLLYEYKVNPLDVKYILFAHTADYVAPCGINLLADVVKNFGFIHALCFGSTLYKCAGAFHLLKLADTLFVR